MQKLKRLIVYILCFFSVLIVKGQEKDTSGYGMGMILGGDTIIERHLKEIWVYPQRNFKNKKHERNFWKYVYKVKKVYPYAKTANDLLKKYEPEYEKLKTNKQKRKLMNHIEDELMAQYKEDLKKMTISEGRILIKLIDRETGRTSYSLIKDFRGGFSAFFWQSLARFFGNDLKSEFDPYGEDRIIDEIVRMIESGMI